METNFFDVWHRVTPTFLDNPADVLAAFPEGFVRVAAVRTPEVGRVFELTNSIDAGWWLNPEVTPTVAVRARGGARSTSVGDVIQQGTRRWSVQGIGLLEF